MARVTTVSFGRTINTGNFQSERYDITVEVHEGEDPVLVASGLKFLVDQMYMARGAEQYAHFTEVVAEDPRGTSDVGEAYKGWVDDLPR